MDKISCVPCSTSHGRKSRIRKWNKTWTNTKQMCANQQLKLAQDVAAAFNLIPLFIQEVDLFQELYSSVPRITDHKKRPHLEWSFLLLFHSITMSNSDRQLRIDNSAKLRRREIRGTKESPFFDSFNVSKSSLVSFQFRFIMIIDVMLIPFSRLISVWLFGSGGVTFGSFARIRWQFWQFSRRFCFSTFFWWKDSEGKFIKILLMRTLINTLTYFAG